MRQSCTSVKITDDVVCGAYNNVSTLQKNALRYFGDRLSISKPSAKRRNKKTPVDAATLW
jgi:hypothetical protein